MEQQAEPLILRHRPREFAQVHGHAAQVTALERRLHEPNPPHCYLFTGPSGVGKTTLARITSRVLDAEIIPIDGASQSGVAEMRSLLDDYATIRTSIARLIVIDECHRLSPNARDAALMTLEEPPPHLFFALCTTEYGRVHETIRTRSYHVKLDRLTDREIEEFLVDIIVAEDWSDTVDPGVFNVIVHEANGSPRQALSLLQVAYDAPDTAEAQRIIALQGSPEPVRQVLSMLMTGQGSWDHIRPLLAQLSDESFTEDILIGACRYVGGGLLRETRAERARRLWELLASLTYPARGYDPKSIFLAAIGRMLWSSV